MAIFLLYNLVKVGSDMLSKIYSCTNARDVSYLHLDASALVNPFIFSSYLSHSRSISLSLYSPRDPQWWPLSSPLLISLFMSHLKLIQPFVHNECNLLSQISQVRCFHMIIRAFRSFAKKRWINSVRAN